MNRAITLINGSQLSALGSHLSYSSLQCDSEIWQAALAVAEEKRHSKTPASAGVKKIEY